MILHSIWNIPSLWKVRVDLFHSFYLMYSSHTWKGQCSSYYIHCVLQSPERIIKWRKSSFFQQVQMKNTFLRTIHALLNPIEAFSDLMLPIRRASSSSLFACAFPKLWQITYAYAKSCWGIGKVTVHFLTQFNWQPLALQSSPLNTRNVISLSFSRSTTFTITTCNEL